jgi:SAM-dependent methyltransferase
MIKCSTHDPAKQTKKTANAATAEGASPSDRVVLQWATSKKVESRSGADRIRSYYNRNPEKDRLGSPQGRLEYERSKAVISRYLGAPPLSVLDAAGGTGAYSFWLAGLGHRVTFMDLSDAHVAAVRERNRTADAPLVDVRQGNVLDPDLPPGAFDLVLNMGPMYHLPAGQRLEALHALGLLLNRGGILISAYISPFAALMDGYSDDYILDPEFGPLAIGDIAKGVHEPPGHDRYFTLAYMHRPEEIGPEITAAGLHLRALVAVEGFFWTYQNLGTYTEDPDRFRQLMEHARLIESEPSIMGASAHMLSVAERR